MKLFIHKTSKISVSQMERLTDDRGRPFYAVHLLIETSKGEELDISVFADDPSALRVLNDH